MLALTVKGLLAHKRRLVSTTIAVLLGVAFMSGSLVFTDTMKQSLAGVFADSERGTDAFVRGPATFPGFSGTQHGPVPADLLDVVAEVDGVAAAAVRLEGYAQVLDADGRPVDDLSRGAMPVGAAWSSTPALNPFRLVAGSGPARDDEVVIDRSIARDAGLSVGDEVTVLTGAAPQRLRVSGVATFAGRDDRAGARTVLFTPAAAADLLGRQGTVDGIAVTSDGVGQDELVRRLEAALPASVDAVTGSVLAAESADRQNEDVAFFGLFMTVFAVVALLVGGFVIHNTFTILVAQRTRELALLRAVGAGARQVRRSVALEALLVGSVASAVGLLLGVGVARAITALFGSFGVSLPEGELVVSTRSMLVAFAVGVVVTTASALLPARRAARVAPVAALREVAVDRSGTSRRRTAAGLVLLSAGIAGVVGGIAGGSTPPVLLGALACFLGVATAAPLLAWPAVRGLGVLLPRLVGVRGHLARENAARNPRRTAATASALMVGVALVGAITVFAASGKWSVTTSFDTEFRGDLVLESGAWMHGGLSPTLGAALADRQEVGAVAAKQFTQARVGDAVTELAGWPSDAVETVFDLGVSEGRVAALGSDGIAVGSAYAEDRGWELGSVVPVRLGNGAGRDFTVRALFDRPDWVGKAWVDRTAFAALAPEALDTDVFVTGADGTSPQQLRAVVDAVAAGYPSAEVQDRTEVRQSVVEEFNAILGIVYALLALAVAIVLLGIANTVSLSVVERTRELGMLRAVGMARGHLRGMVRWEAGLFAVFGTLTGLAVGLFLGWAMVFAVAQSGTATARTVVPVGQLAVVVAVAGACGVLAAVLPARRAARLDVLAAVRAS